jgi:putative inorganic carbon (HCO3(-)) transporter
MAGFVGLASGLPFIVTTRWYDFYYWPKIVVLYSLLLELTVVALLTDRARWLESVRSPLGRALLVWLGAVTASTVLSVAPLQSLVGADYRYEGLWTWLAYGTIVAGVASTFITAARIRLLLTALLIAAAGMAGLGLVQHFGWAPVPPDPLRVDWTRAWGTTGNPVALGGYLVLLLPVAISLYAYDPRPGWRWVFGALVVLLCAALVATRTRAAWGALVVGAGAWAAASDPHRLRGAVRPLLVLVILLAAVTPAVLLTGTVIRPAASVTGPAAPSLAAQVSSRQTAQQRAFLWWTTVPLVWQRPLLGWGPETLGEIFPAYKSPEFLRLFPEAQQMRLTVDRPHNDLLQQALSTGLLGLAGYVWLWATIFRAAWRTARFERIHESPTGVFPGLLGGVVAYFCQLQFSFNYVSVAPVFWTVVGILAALEAHGLREGSLTVLNFPFDGRTRE